MEQLELFENKTIAERFRRFHSEHPVVYLLFEKFAGQLIAKGYKKFGAKMIIERIRWECYTGSTDGLWKINNDFISHYARLYAERNPAYKDFLEFRSLKTA